MTIHVSTLTNGMQVVTDTIDKVETAAVGIWVNNGARNEPPQVNGIAHMLEHMAFKGTHTRSAQDIAQQIENVGGYLNAATSRESTAYYARVLQEDVPLALDILADILQNSTFDAEELEKEKAVVLQEIGQTHDTPDDIIGDYFQETAFPNQAMGRPILGTGEIVQSIDRKTLKTYMQRNYAGSQMVLSASGKVDHEQIVNLAEQLFGALPSVCSVKSYPADYQGGDFRQQRDLDQVHLILGFQGISFTHEYYYALTVLSAILGGGMSSRLFQEVREKRGLAYTISTFKQSYSDSGIFGVYSGTSPEKANELIEVTCDEIMKISNNISETEIKRAKSQLKAALMMGLESTASRCEQMAYHLLYYKRPLSSTEIIEKIEAVDKTMITNVANLVFASKPTFAALGQVEQIKPYADILQTLGHVQKPHLTSAAK